jgi:hypothetical protein
MAIGTARDADMDVASKLVASPNRFDRRFEIVE